MGGFPPFHRFSKRSEVSLQVFNRVKKPHRVHDGAWVISFSEAFHLHINTPGSVRALPVPASTQDKYGNEWINKQKWNHIAPWERNTPSSCNICCNKGGMKGSCWVYLFIADTFPSIFWWRKSPVELWLTQMCPLCSYDDGGTGQIKNRLQEARKFEGNVTLIHKIW